jgi:hypothetical protein
MKMRPSSLGTALALGLLVIGGFAADRALAGSGGTTTCTATLWNGTVMTVTCTITCPKGKIISCHNVINDQNEVVAVECVCIDDPNDPGSLFPL